MKNKTGILTVGILLLVGFSGVHLLARQTRTATVTPCNEDADTDKAQKKDARADYEPFADPAEMMRLRAQKKIEEKAFKELQDAATQLAAISTKMSKDIDGGGQYVVSLRVLDELNQIEKLTKKVRSLTK